MIETILELATEAIKISFLVAIMMILVDIINVLTKKKLESFFKNAKRFRQYIYASLIGTTPGCIGGFANVSLYIHGLISFGALAGSMIAVSGDEAFVMIAMFPKDAVILFAILFIIGIFSGWTIDFIIAKYKISTCKNCKEMVTHPRENSFRHYLTEHVYGHIIKKHLWKVALWTFGALVVVQFGLQYLHLEEFTSQYKIVFLIVGALVGLIPESGPHLIFVTLFAQGLVPFSVLLTSSIVQDGHGMLPMLSYSLKDSIKLKIFNFSIGIIIGLMFYSLGL